MDIVADIIVDIVVDIVENIVVDLIVDLVVDIVVDTVVDTQKNRSYHMKAKAIKCRGSRKTANERSTDNRHK